MGFFEGIPQGPTWFPPPVELARVERRQGLALDVTPGSAAAGAPWACWSGALATPGQTPGSRQPSALENI